MLHEILSTYLKFFPDDAARLKRLSAQIKNGEKLNDRRNFNGHITGAGIVLSPDKSQILLIYHKTFQKWLQPGGHWESDDEADPLQAAIRETKEETGLVGIEYMPVDKAAPLVPIDVETHRISSWSKQYEPNHWHHDFRYVFVAADTALVHQEDEVSAASWFDFDAPETAHVRQVIAKLRQFDFISS